MTETPLDRAHRLMEAAADDPHARAVFFERLLDAELTVLLEEDGSAFQVLSLSEGQVVLAFDLPERVAEFAGHAVATADLSGRTLMAVLAGKATGVGLNLGGAPSAYVFPPDVVDWLAAQFARGAETAVAAIAEVRRPQALSASAVAALGEKAAALASLARCILVADATFGDGSEGALIAIVDPVPGAEDGITEALRESIAFSGGSRHPVTFLSVTSGDAVVIRLDRVSLKIEIPERSETVIPEAPGSNPAKPPRLR